jgi:hypothetical protein
MLLQASSAISKLDTEALTAMFPVIRPPNVTVNVPASSSVPVVPCTDLHGCSTSDREVPLSGKLQKPGRQDLLLAVSQLARSSKINQFVQKPPSKTGCYFEQCFRHSRIPRASF